MSDTEEVTNIDENENEPESISNRYVNDITLTYFMNKSQRNKYVSKTNPEQHKKEEKYKSSLRKYKTKILDLTKTLLNDPNKEITTDVNEVFRDYTETIIRYLKMKEIEEKEHYNSSDEDTLFGNMDDSSSEEEEKVEISNEMTSFWGHRIIKK